MAMNAPASQIIKNRRVRQSVVDGIFYPSTAEELSFRMSALAESAYSIPGLSSAIIAPHGSLDYSGSIAAQAWKSASARTIGTIIIVGPSHHCFEPGIVIPESKVFSIPTQDFFVDRPVLRELKHTNMDIVENDIPHLEDHSIEMQLLFASYFFPQASIIPLLVSDVDLQSIGKLFAQLQFILGDRIGSTLLVITSNMAVEETEQRCLESTQAFISALETRNISALIEGYHGTPSFCGRNIIAGYLQSNLSSAMETNWLGTATSAAFSDPGDPIVGYSAISFSR
jgi:AmmeMemoRadiSam system protein B